MEQQAKTHELWSCIRQIDELNERSWAKRFQNPKQALQDARAAQQLSEQNGYQRGLAYSLLHQGVAQWVLSSFGEAYQCLGEARKKMVELGDKLGEAKAINWLGNTLERLGKNVEALNCHLRAVELRKQLGDKEGIAISLNNIGNLYLRLEDYPTALSYYLNALQIREEIGDKEGQAATFTNIGIIYYRTGKYKEAKEYAQKGLDGFCEHLNLQGYAHALSNLGLVYVELGEEAEAERCYQESQKIYAELGDKQGEANALNNLGLLWAKRGEYEKALQCYEKSLSLTRQAGDTFFEVETLLNIGNLYAKQKHDADARQSALRYLLQTKSLAAQIGSKRYVAEACKAISECYETQGDVKQAFEYFKLYEHINVQLLKERSEERIHTLSVQYEVEKAQQEAEIYRLRNIELVEANEKLADANQKLREANQLKSELLAIAAHDLKNPLAAILELVQIALQTADLERQTRILCFIRDSAERMLSIVQQVLEMSVLDSGNLQLKRKRINLSQLTQHIVASYEPCAVKKRIQLKENIEEGITVSVDESRLSEVIENLISNAIKYSYPEKEIWVHLRRQERGEKLNLPVVQIVVQDEGQGLTEEDMQKLFKRFQRLSAKPTGGESSTGLGLSIAKQLVELHGGTIWAHSEGKNKGTTFTVELPLS
ncbi:MAG: tetratricopeptide repeat-containing sensor histidine kinase [Chloroherpetonaceae bacterium]|nr:tetratricopeptide repeat-containing sensor histidine kinase [Chloroherpetonaceae bacterium]